MSWVRPGQGDPMPPLVLHVTGARPNFPKAAPVIRALRARGVEQRLVHTGQHYDEQMSDVFFRQLGLPEPDVNLGVGSGSHAQQTAAVMVGPGDAVPRAPARARRGVRRRQLDGRGRAGRRQAADPARPRRGRAAQLRPARCPRRSTGWSPTGSPTCSSRPARTPSPTWATRASPAHRIHFVGNPMIDTLLANLDRFDAAAARDAARPRRRATPSPRCTARPTSTTRRTRRPWSRRCTPSPTRSRSCCRSTRAAGAALDAAGLLDHPGIRVVDPLGYVEFLGLVRGADAVVTDSGGVQEETTVLGVPCLTLRPNTERPVTITHGTNRLVTREDLAWRVERGAGGRPRTWTTGCRRCGTATPARGSPTSSWRRSDDAPPPAASSPLRARRPAGHRAGPSRPDRRGDPRPVQRAGLPLRVGPGHLRAGRLARGARADPARPALRGVGLAGQRRRAGGCT